MARKSMLCRYLVFSAVIFLATFTQAQAPMARGMSSYHPYELAGTFSHMLTDGSYGSPKTLNGFTAAGSANIWSFANAAVEVGGYYGGRVSLTSFLAGPQLGFHLYRFQPFIRGLFGMSHTKIGSGTANGFTIATGGGLNYLLTDRIAIRALQVDYFKPSGTFYNQADFLRIGFGVSYQFGTR